jgi:hypothetical protein
MTQAPRTRAGLFVATSVLNAMIVLVGVVAADEPARAILRDDLYIAGSNVVVSRDVAGDLVAAGRVVAVKAKSPRTPSWPEARWRSRATSETSFALGAGR